MEIFGIGMSELIFVLIIALIVLGPKDMQKAGKTIGRWLRNIVTSDGWKAFQQTSRELRNLPNRLMRDANEEINKIGSEISGSDPARTRSRNYGDPERLRPAPPTRPATQVPAPETTDSSQSETSKDDAEPNA